MFMNEASWSLKPGKYVGYSQGVTLDLSINLSSHSLSLLSLSSSLPLLFSPSIPIFYMSLANYNDDQSPSTYPPLALAHSLSVCRNFVEEKLEVKYTEGRKTEFAKSFRESGPASPVFFILSPGVDPL